MPIPYYRYVRYTDDGCGIEQCLNCYQEWEGRTGANNWIYCPYCACKWTGKLECREKYEAAWEYRLKKTNEAAYMRWQQRRLEDRPKLTRGWIIEVRETTETSSDIRVGDWTVHTRQNDYGETTLRMVVNELRHLRIIEADNQKRAKKKKTKKVLGFWSSKEYRARIADLKYPMICGLNLNIPQYTNLGDKTLLELWRFAGWGK